MAVTDMDGDGLDDVIQLDQGRHVYVLYQEQDGSFTTFDYGTVDNTSQWGWAIADLSNDGHKDICSGAYGSTHFVSIAARGVSATSDLDGPDIFTQNMSMADMDNDGRVDVFACHDNGPPSIWFTAADGVPLNNNAYIDWSTDPASDMSGNYGSSFIDFDNDGDLDLYISHCRQGVNIPSDPRRWNRLFVNDGTNHYTDLAATYGVQDHEQSWATDFGDYDNDGDLDMFTIEHSTGNKLFQNDGTGHYTEVASSSTGLGVTSFPLQAMFRDLDNDGFLDILVAGGESHYYRGNGDGTFTEMTGVIGTSSLHGFAFGDLNRDGFEDVYANYGENYNYVTPSGTADKLWLNTPNGNHFFRVRLQGTVSNRDAIGARVTITGPWGTQIREVRSGESYGLVHSFALGFGLGSATSVPTMSIRWPSGAVETFTDLAADQEITVVEGECISPDLVIAASNDGMLCPGTPMTLTVTPATDITWSTGSTEASITVDQPGSYWVRTTVGGCTTQATRNIIPFPNAVPVITVEGPARICSLDHAVLTCSAASGYQWSNGSDQQSISVNEAGQYTVTAQGVCGAQTSAPVTISVVASPDAPIASDASLPVPGTAQLVATGDSVLWYDVATAGAHIGSGSPWTTPWVATNTTYWCSQVQRNEGPLTTGGKPEHGGNGDYQNNNSYYLEFSTTGPMVILRAKVYANGAGNRQVGIYNRDSDVLVASGSYDVPNGQSTMQLDLMVPAAGEYDLRMITEDPQLWRDAGGSGVDYPYDLAGLGTITGSNAGNDYYYYFYNWEVSGWLSFCESERTPAQVHVGPSSVGTVGGSDGIMLFPNPASGIITLSGQWPVGATGAILLDATGRVCLSVPMAAGNMAIDVSALAAGPYTVRIRGEHGISNLPFVKQ